MLAFAFFRSFLLLSFLLFPLGIGLLRFIETRLEFRLAGEFQRLSFAFILGSAFTFLFPLAAALLYPAAFATVAALQMLLSAVAAFFFLRPRKFPARPSPFFFLTASLLALIDLGSLFVLLGGVVPGSILFDYGDTPSWYRAAQNILAGVKPWEDTWIADYGGSYLIPATFPLPAVIIAWQMAVLSFAPYALEAYCLLAGLLGLGVLAELVKELGPAEDPRWGYFCALCPTVLFLASGNLLLFFFTHPSLIVLNGVLLLVSFARVSAVRARRTIIVGTSLFLLTVHPLSFFFLASIGASALLQVVSRGGNGFRFYALFIFSLVAGVLLFSFIGSVRYSIFPYLQYGAEGWGSVFHPWREYNLYLSNLALGIPAASVHVNANVTWEILSHPISFLVFFAGLLGNNIGEALPLALVLLGFTIVFQFSKVAGRTRVWLVAACFYFALNQSLVLSFRERHFFPALALLAIPALGVPGILWRKWKSAAGLGLLVTTIVVVWINFPLAWQAKESRQQMNVGLFTAAQYLSSRMQESDEVLTNQPKSLAYVLSRPLKGGHFLGEDVPFTDGFLAKDKPKFLVLFGPNALNMKAAQPQGYELTLDKPAFPLAIFERK